MHEEWFRGSVSAAREHFAEPRGEFTLVIQGLEESIRGSDSAALERLGALRAKGAKPQEAVKEVSKALNIPRRAVYQLWLSLK
jgi:16S rRNA (cytidine1402-2'-O)-methyltransferase